LHDVAEHDVRYCNRHGGIIGNDRPGRQAQTFAAGACGRRLPLRGPTAVCSLAPSCERHAEGAATLRIPAGARLVAALLAASPLIQVAAVLAGQRFLGFGDPSASGYVVNLAAAPITAGLLLRRHWRARFSVYLFFTLQLARGARAGDVPLLVLSALVLAAFQLPSVVRVYPRLRSRSIWARWFGTPREGEMPDGAAPKIRHGVLGGLIGGSVFAAIMVVNGTLTELGMMTLPLIGRLVGHPSAWVGLGVHTLNSLVIGASYVLLFGRIEKGMIDGMHFGMLYGLVWWFVGPMTLMPLLLGLDVGSQWTLDAFLRTFPSLIGHLVYGAILGMTVGWFHDASLPAPAPGKRPSAAPARPPSRSAAAGGPREP
jgi:hypothetical protein